MGTRLEKLRLSIWKEWASIKNEHNGELGCCIMITILFFFIMWIVHRTSFVKKNEELVYPAFNITPGNKDFMLCNGINRSFVAAYSPTSSLLFRIVSNICETATVAEFQTVAKLNDKIDKDINFKQSLAFAIEFNDELLGISSTTDLPSKVDVTLRLTKSPIWHTNVLYPHLQTPGPRSQNESDGGEPNYHKRGFLYIQHSIASAFINDGELKPPDWQIQMKRFPFPTWWDNEFFDRRIKIIISFLIPFSLLCFYKFMIRDIMRQKELMKLMEIMGQPRWCLWVALLLKNLIISLLTMSLVFLIIRPSKEGIYKYSDPTLLFVFFMLFACCTIALAFLVCAFSSDENNACNLGYIVYIFTNLPLLFLEVLPINATASYMLALSLLSNSGVAFGMLLILDYETFGEGAHWANLLNSISPGHDISFGLIMIMLLVDTILYLTVAWYVDTIRFAKYETFQPWPFSFFCASGRNETLTDVPSTNNGEDFEKYTGNLPVGIRLLNLSKNLKSKSVVTNLNLDMYEGHITILLGDNGAGKTVTASLITGLCPPTSGTAIVNGCDVRTDLQKIRSSLGFCPQDNVCFSKLSVWDHLFLSGKLKGMKDKQLKQEIEDFLLISGLNEKKKEDPTKLPRDMMRTLNVGMALCGNPKVVILDDPTNGMDTSSRREMWSLLEQRKQGRTILITTCSMDEAYFLGDRIAIMSMGEVQCCGSKAFLKQKFGNDYYLFMDVAPEGEPDRIISFLKNYAATVKLRAFVGSKLSFRLLQKESAKFDVMLSDLENNMSSLGVQSYGISVTTLREVFTKFGVVSDNKSTTSKTNETPAENRSSSKQKIENCTRLSLIKNQLVAIFLKNILISFRSWYWFLAAICVQIVLLLVMVLSGRSFYEFTTIYPPLKISLDTYAEPVTLVSGDENKYDYKMYQEVLDGYQLTKVENVNDEILKLTSEIFSEFRIKYIVAASFNDDIAIAWFNGDPYHAPPLALSLVLNSFYKNRYGPESLINFLNNPLPPSLDAQLAHDNLRFSGMGFHLAIAIGLGMTMVFGIYLAFCIHERISGAKHLQFLYGIDPLMYWGSSFICHFITFLIILSVVIFTLGVFQEDGFKTPDELGRLTIVLITFGACMLIYVYVKSHHLENNVLAIMMCRYLILALVPFSAVLLLEYENYQFAAEIVHWIFLFHPFYSVTKAIYDLRKIHDLRKICSAFGNFKFACTQNNMCCNIEEYFSLSTPGVGRNIIINICWFIFGFAILMCLGCDLFAKISNKLFCCKKRLIEDVMLEDAVQEENNIIKNTQQNVLVHTYIVVLRNVTTYHKCKLALNSLCLGVKPSECFGLLGASGAGKTTLLKLMAGDIRIFSGDIWVNGLNVKKELRKVCKATGYCPQLNALLDNLTARETLRIMCLIRGIPSKTCKSISEQLAYELDFFKHLDKKIKEISYDSKRKLCVAIALIGDPPVVYFDEPTTGMDQTSKSIIWGSLTKLRNSGKCVILSSQDLQECEVLCTRLAILVEGKLQYLGSIERFKNKFVQGYAMTIKIKKKSESTRLENQIKNFDKFIQKNFSGAQLKDTYHETLFYELENPSVLLSNVFKILEKNKKTQSIEGYTLEQRGLKDVFQRFATNSQQSDQQSDQESEASNQE